MRRRWPILFLASTALVVAAALAAWRAFEAVRFEDGLARARAEMDSGRFESARRWLSAHRRSGADRPEVAYWLGICEQVDGRHAEAIADWSLVPANSPLAPRASLAQAQVLVGDLGRFADAEPRLVEAIRGRGPEGIEAIHALSQLFFWEGRTAEMRRLIEDSFDRLPDPSAELRDLWRIDNVSVEVEDVREAVDSASAKAPEDDRVWLARAYLATIAGHYSEAGRHLDACLARRPDDPAVWRARLRWAIASDRVDEVRRALPRIPAEPSDRAEALDIRGWLARMSGDREAERSALEASLALNPGRPHALGRLVALASRAGLEDRADDYRARLVAANRSTARYQEILSGKGPLASFAELSRLADALGRRFEARGWRFLASRSPNIDPDLREAIDRDRIRIRPEPIPAGSTLADLVNPAR